MSNHTIRVVLSAYLIVSLCLFFPPSATALHGGGKKDDGGGVPVPLPVAGKHGTMVTKDERRAVVSTEFGEISGVKVSDGRAGFYDLQFITMEPNSLFVPAYLHSDMVFFVSSGSGTLSWVDLEKDSYKLRQVDLRTGDVYRLRTGSFFYLQSNLDSDRRKFRVNAIFSDSKEEIREGSSFGAYSTVGDLLLGFDDKILQAALNVDEETIQVLKSGGRQPMIVHGVSKVEQVFEVHYRTMRAFLGLMENGVIEVNKNKKDKAYNILEAKHDFENCNGWSLIVTSKQMDALKDSDFGVFMVNLTKGAMMGPHWNPMTAEVAVVLSGRGMVHVVCPSSTADEAECKNSRFRVEEGDVFVVPRYHPMAQISFNNGSFVFFGFTTTQKKNHPQYLVGSASVFQVLDKRVLAASLGVSNVTMDEILSSQKESVILECTSCAEEEERLMEEEIERQKEEEEREREEEEEERKKEEEEREREEEEEREREEEEEARKKEEEEREREEEEARKKEEEEREREEEEARRQEEEARREQEEARKREEEARREEAKRRQEEEEARREQEEQEAARRQEEEAAARRQEEEAARRRQEEEAAAREQEEEAARRRQEEEEAAREQEEAAASRRQEEEAARQHDEEAARRRQEQEGARRRHEHEAARRQEEATARRRQKHEGGRPQDEAARRRQQEQEAARQQEEAMRRKEEEEARWGGHSSRERGHQEEAGGGGMTEINFIY